MKQGKIPSTEGKEERGNLTPKPCDNCTPLERNFSVVQPASNSTSLYALH